MNRPKSKSTTAPDILSKSQNWMQKVSSLRLSNIRVGYQLTSLIGSENKKDNDHKDSKIQDTFVPLFVKIVSYSDCYYIILGGVSGIRICQVHEATSTTTDVTVELIYEDISISCIDCCLYDPTHSQLSFAILLSGEKRDDTTHVIRIVVLDNPPRTVFEHEFEGVAEKIASTNSFLLVAISPGSLRIFFGEKLQPITEIPSIYYTPVVFATAPRWIAVQIPQKDVGSNAVTNAIVSHTPSQLQEDNLENYSASSSGDTARRVVSGIYTLSKMSWQAVQPFISQAYSSQTKSSKQSPPDISRPQPEVGGGILVLDLESYQNHRNEDYEKSQENKIHDPSSETLPIITHFISHVGESLSAISFSPTGLKLASADINGQVILVHALVPSGLTSHSHEVVGLLSTNRPYLLYKLVRGLTLAKIIDIGFDNSESIAFASSFNGTVHIFDLNSTSTESNEIRSTPSSWSRSSLHDSGTSPLNPLNLLGISGFSSSNHSNGVTHHPPLSSRTDVEDPQVPFINVSQFLQLHRPDLRTLHGYSEMKIKLPLRESPLQDRNGINGQKKEDLLDDELDSHRDRLPSDSDPHIASVNNNTSFFHEVNMNTSTVILPSINYLTSAMDGTPTDEPVGKYEMLIASSEGILNRYQVSLKSSNGNQPTSNYLRELNRWDLCAPLATNSYTPPQSTTQPSSPSSSTSWIMAVGHRSDLIVDIPPIWLRPQCSLRMYRQENVGKQLPSDERNTSQVSSPTLPIPIESSAASLLRKKKSSKKYKEVSETDSELVDTTNEESSNPLTESQLFFFPERRPTFLLKVDRHNISLMNSNSEIGEKIHSALVAELPEIPHSEHKSHIVITKRIDDITAWEMDEDWVEE